MNAAKNRFSDPLSLYDFLRVRLRAILLLLFWTATVSAQPKIAIVAPDKTARSTDFAEKLAALISKNARVIDVSQSAAAFAAQNFEKPFNLSATEAKNAGAAIGADYFLLVKSENLRRAALSKGDFYESYAAIFAVNSRSGQLALWKLASFEAGAATDADRKLFDSARDFAAEIGAKLKNDAAESLEKTESRFEKMPLEDAPGAKNFRPPLPFKRFRPEYTPLARLYSVEATVDVEFDIDETGKITKIETLRWAGYGLDEAVAENIRKMNWRPAQRDGKNIPLRVLLRYNFRKLDRD